ncbi:MAG: PEP-CTERM sorting domain-containing protein [Bryobacteraceae bacterium]
MDLRTPLQAAACAFGVLCFCAAMTVQAATINVTYAFSGTGSGDPTNPPIIGSGTGSLSPLGSMKWTGLNYINLTTGENNGTFTIAFANGDTLVGTLHEQDDLSSPPTVPFTQVLNVTGGTGSFLWYNGTLTGGGTINLAAGTFSTAGSGTLSTTPEPGSVALLLVGLVCLVTYRKRGTPTGVRLSATRKLV